MRDDGDDGNDDGGYSTGPGDTNNYDPRKGDGGNDTGCGDNCNTNFHDHD